jgi:HSP20 family molecular chaperone IbpA
MMRPLAKEEETDAEVTWEDQNNINTFSKLHNKLADLQDLLTDKNVQTPFRNGVLTVDAPRVARRCAAGSRAVD